MLSLPRYLVSRFLDWLRAAMLDVSVDLGSIKVAGKKPTLSLTLSTSFTISLPPSWHKPATAEDLRQASSAGKIWISKAGSCQIDVLTLVNDESPDSVFEPTTTAAVVGLASECPTWKHIGLELRANHASHARPDRSQTQASYFLHHPDLSSGLIAPSNVPSARFQGLTCTANYRLGLPKNKPEIPRQPADEPLSTGQYALEAPSQHMYGLRSNPKRSRKAAVAQEEIEDALVSLPSSHFETETTSGDTTTEDMVEDMTSLLDFALRKLIGIRRASPGLRTVKSTPSPSLIDIAPAVWNLQYLQTMAVHAQIIPSIANGIARLRNAQSTSLRKKLDTITRHRVSDNQKPLDAEACVTEEFQERLWLLCQTRIRPEPVNEPRAKRRTDEVPIKEEPSQTEVTGPMVLHGDFPHYFGGFGGGALVEMESYELVAEHDPYSEFDEEELYDTDFPDAHGLPHGLGTYMVDDGEPSTEDWTGSSEGDYFYTDGNGNVYPVETHNAQEADEVDWHSGQQMIELEGFSYEEEEEIPMGIHDNEIGWHPNQQLMIEPDGFDHEEDQRQMGAYANKVGWHLNQQLMIEPEDFSHEEEGEMWVYADENAEQ